MDSFVVAQVLLGVGALATLAESAAHFFLVPVAFQVGPVGVSVVTRAALPPGLTVPLRSHTRSLVYRVLPQHVCLFRPRPVGGMRSPFGIVGTVRWAEGSLHHVGRYVIGPFIVLLAPLVVLGDAVAGFLRQGEPWQASSTLLVCAIVLAIPVVSYRSARRRFPGMCEEIQNELLMPAGAPGAMRE